MSTGDLRAPGEILVHLRRARDHADRELSAKGVEFLQPPSQRPYGTDALCRDNSGNWLVLVQPSNEPVSADDFS